MKCLLALVVVCGVASSMLAVGDEQAKAKTTVQIVPKWKVGEVHRYILAKSRKRTEGGKVAVVGQARTPVEARVTEVTEDGGAIIVWTRGASRLLDEKANKDPQVRRMIDMMKDLKVELVMDDSGSVQSVRNWREIQKRLRAWTDALVNVAGTSKLPPQEAAKLRSNMEAMIGSEEKVNLMCTREPRLLFIPVGLSFEGKEPLTYEGEMGNPIGGPPYPCHGAFRLKSNDNKTGRITIEWEESVTPADADRVLNETLAAVNKRLGRPDPGPDAKKPPAMLLSDSGTFRLDSKTGWVDSLTYTHSVQQGDTTQADVTKFEPVHTPNGQPTPTAR